MWTRKLKRWCWIWIRDWQWCRYAISGIGYLTVIGVGVACTAVPTPDEEVEPEPLPITLVGMWEKQTSTPCGALYPDTLLFMESFQYRGMKQDGSFSIWDVGTYEVTLEGKIWISTATDAIVQYPFHMKEGVLTFTVSDSCDIEYQQME